MSKRTGCPTENGPHNTFNLEAMHNPVFRTDNSFTDSPLDKKDVLNILTSSVTLSQMPDGDANCYFAANAFPTSRGSILQKACYDALKQHPRIARRLDRTRPFA